jgi:sugar phosphate isomerase/epimerase
MARKKISIGTWAYTIGPYANNPVPFETVVSKLKEIGFDGIDLGGFPPHPNPDDCPTPESRKKVRGLVEDAGLGFSGLAANLWMHKLASSESNTALLAEFDKNVKFCNDLGIKTIRVDSLDPPTVLDTMDYNLARSRVVSTFKEMAKRAGNAGLNVCWEFEPGFCFNKPSEIISIIDEVSADHKNFGALYDTCHANMVAKIGSRQPGKKETLKGGALELLQKLKGKITHVHLIDSDDICHKDANGEDETSSHPPFGEGILNFEELTPAILDCGCPHDWWTIDLCFWPDAWAATEKCYRYLDELRKKYNVG